MKNYLLAIIWLLTTATLSAESIKVKGYATISKPAEIAHLTIGVTTEKKAAKDALETNSIQMNSLITAIQSLGLPDLDLKTGQFSIFPIRNEEPGFRVTNTLNISTRKVEQLGPLIDAATRAGANQINSLSFSLEDQRQYREELLELATAHAMEDAKTLAQAAKVELGGIKSIEMTEPNYAPRTAMLSARATPIEPRDVELSATVEMEFSIE